MSVAPTYLSIAKRFIPDIPKESCISEPDAPISFSLADIPSYYVHKIEIKDRDIRDISDYNSAYKVAEEILLNKVLLKEESKKNLFDHLYWKLQNETNWHDVIVANKIVSEKSRSCPMCYGPEDLDCIEINGFRFLFSDFALDRQFIAKVCKYYNNILGNCYVSIKIKRSYNRKIKKLIQSVIDGSICYYTPLICVDEDFFVIGISPRR